MSKKVKVCGEIVHDGYDCDFFAEDIEKGILTPSSRVVKQFEEAEDGEEIEVVIDSYGGDVWAGNAMFNAAEAAMKRGCKCSVTIGAKAFSMGSTLAVMLKADGCRVTASRNSLYMFHSAYAETAGGPQAHEDEAKALRISNQNVIADLEKLGITDCRAWFSEGRMHWIGAQEALEIGLVDEITNVNAPTLAGQSARMPMRLAACLKEYQMNEETEKPAEQQPDNPAPEVHPEATATEGDANPETPASESQPEQSVPMARFAGMQAAKDKEIHQLQGELALARGDADKLRGAMDKLTADVADRNEALKQANGQLEQLKADLANAQKDLAERQAAIEAKEQQYREHVGFALTQPPEAVMTYAEKLAAAKTPQEKVKLAYAEAHK